MVVDFSPPSDLCHGTVPSATVLARHSSVDVESSRVPPAYSFAMGKRKVVDGCSSSDDSPASSSGVHYSDQGSSLNSITDWRSLSWAFGLSPTSRRRGRRHKKTTVKEEERNERGGGLMKELLDIVLWNDEREIDITEELTDEEEDDDDDEELECIKRAFAHEQTLRPLRPIVRNVERGEKREESSGTLSNRLSVSTLRFDSLLKIGSTAELTSSPSIARLEQRTTTMDRAFQGVLEDRYFSEGQKASGSSTKKNESKSTVTAPSDDSENFWDDVVF
ncbi:hypothetical protein PFISCL1PPCAC_775 [Pristionchus fissidentatus]|uniref:Uncharacterized protein n=1 Tax=Pristionchus fissidentatus TaxID=1538716 RepID=A0AAV5UTD0_9BILA|nr:hypothetical protein PFISCL1PPCAC_775 [Pristionchus fissidentatus]